VAAVGAGRHPGRQLADGNGGALTVLVAVSITDTLLSK
jgi:hypothetical protein